MSDSSYQASTGDIDLKTTVAATPELNFSGYRKGVVYVPAASSITTLTWHAADVSGGNYEAVYSGGTAVTTTVASDRTAALPDELEGAAYIKAVVNANGTVRFSFIS
jgi:hypothetical protein